MSQRIGAADRDAEAVVGSERQLADWMRAGEKPRERWRVGTEHEKLGLRADDHRPVPFEGERGIGALLEGIARLAEAEDPEHAWARIHEDGRLIALARDGASITLEPGGQLELSGVPLRTVFETRHEIETHLDAVRRASEPLGLVWLGLGIQPFHGVEAAPRMPKARYDIMRRYLPTRGELSLHMMHLTATVQANLDWADEADMVRKMRAACALSPVVSALFANSAVAQGKPSGFVSRRLHIWQHTDPDRCGVPRFVFEEGFGYERWVEWALDVPMFFVIRGERYLPARGRTFRRFLAEGLDGERATLFDWDQHLTTLFPEARLKRFIEVRGADAGPLPMLCALPALWKGLLYDDGALDAAGALLAGLTHEERVAALDAVARRGLRAVVGGRPVRDWARETVEIASEGLRRIAHGEGAAADERPFLEPLAERAATGRSPADEILERWEGEWNHSEERLIAHARY